MWRKPGPVPVLSTSSGTHRLGFCIGSVHTWDIRPRGNTMWSALGKCVHNGVVMPRGAGSAGHIRPSWSHLQDVICRCASQPCSTGTPLSRTFPKLPFPSVLHHSYVWDLQAGTVPGSALPNSWLAAGGNAAHPCSSSRSLHARTPAQTGWLAALCHPGETWVATPTLNNLPNSYCRFYIIPR